MAGSHVPLRQAIATPQGKRDYTRRVFAKIADRYDLVNVLLSFNRDRAWKRRLSARAAARPGERALDLACGTGDIAFSLSASGASVVGLDITPRMIELARQKQGPKVRRSGGPRARPSDFRTVGRSGGQEAAGTRGQAAAVDFLVGDMMALPFECETFDLVTTGYGIRNVPDLHGALHEILRVLKPGGRFFSLDFNRPANRVVRGAYLVYLAVVGSAFGWVLHGDADTYRYIPETIRLYPSAGEIVSRLASVGFEEPRFEPVFGGFMAMHWAVKGR